MKTPGAWRALCIAVSIGLVAGAAAAQPRGPTVKPRFMMVGVNVTDLQRSSRFYRDVLGMTVKREYRPAGGTFAQVNLGFPGDPDLAPDVTLVWRKGYAPPPGGRALTGRLEFEVPDIQGAVARARALGGKVEREVAPIGGFPGLLGAYLIDPDGHDIELVQRTE